MSEIGDRESLAPAINSQSVEKTSRAEVLPPEKRDSEKMAFFKRPIVQVVGGAICLLSIAAWFVSNFFQLRGYVNVLASRIDLGIAVVLILAFVWIAARNLPKYRMMAGVIGSLIVIVAGFTLDRITLPHSQTAPQNTSTPSNAGPNSGSPQPAAGQTHEPHRIRPTQEVVTSLIVEARMTCTIKNGVPLPESVESIIGGFGSGEITGGGATLELARKNPVEFRKQPNDEMIVINHFYLPSSETVMGRPLNKLLTYDKLAVPITVLGSGSLFDKIKLFEITVTVNDKYTWYYPYNVGEVPFQDGGPMVTVPLAGLRRTLNVQ
jgi:hypothetical protein